MKCLLDLDGVLVDFVSGICAAHGLKSPYEDSKNLGDWGALERECGMSAGAFWRAADSHNFWAELQPMHDMSLILDVCRAHFDDICILSSPTLSPFSLAGKLLWIKKYLPGYARSFLIGSRKDMCAGPDRCLIDDYDMNVKRFREAGGRACLVPRLWNSMHRHSKDTVKVLERQIQMMLANERIASSHATD